MAMGSLLLYFFTYGKAYFHTHINHIRYAIIHSPVLEWISGKLVSRQYARLNLTPKVVLRRKRKQKNPPKNPQSTTHVLDRKAPQWDLSWWLFRADLLVATSWPNTNPVYSAGDIWEHLWQIQHCVWSFQWSMWQRQLPMTLSLHPSIKQFDVVRYQTCKGGTILQISTAAHSLLKITVQSKPQAYMYN